MTDLVIMIIIEIMCFSTILWTSEALSTKKLITNLFTIGHFYQKTTYFKPINPVIIIIFQIGNLKPNESE